MNKIFIPDKKRCFARPKKQKPVIVYEKKPLIEVVSEADRQALAFNINICFQLADIIEGLIIDAETQLKKVNPELGLELRHPIERIKIHTREMVGFVDKVTTPEFQESFGEKSDELKEVIINFYKE